MHVMICGMDGYLGWSLALYLTEAGHTICGIDNNTRRLLVSSVGGDSALPILNYMERCGLYQKTYDRKLNATFIDVRNYKDLHNFVAEEEPDAIVHLAEMPSAPYSMKDPGACLSSYSANTIGHLSLLWVLRDFPNIHLVKLGTMGEYGTPKIPIAEGTYPVLYKGCADNVPPPRDPPSFYHSSKCADSINTKLACKIWNLRATDVMQGIVYGHALPMMVRDPKMQTRYDCDAIFGTVVNRFCAQAALGKPLLLYGGGNQSRALLPLEDSMQCLKLLLEHPARRGEYRVVNQFDRSYTIAQLAHTVADVAESMNMEVTINEVPNPRVEEQNHFFQPESKLLKSLGYLPRGQIGIILGQAITAMSANRARLERMAAVLEPNVYWRQGHASQKCCCNG